MNKLLRNTDSFIRKVRMSNMKYLLVEGESDSKILKQLLKRFRDNNLIKKDKVEVQSAQYIKSNKDTIQGNRHKVEYISKNINKENFAYRFVGFVDREFRDFLIDKTIRDIISSHKVSSRLVWSRGHSIENYFFDQDVLKLYCANASFKLDYYELIEERFQFLYLSILNLSTILSLLAKELNEKYELSFEEIENSISFEFLEIENNQIIIKIDEWLERLKNKIKNKIESTDISSEDFLKETRIIYNDICSIVSLTEDPDTKKFICHGHLGLHCVIEAYKKCLIVVSEEAIKNQIEQINENVTNSKRRKKDKKIQELINFSKDYTKSLIHLGWLDTIQRKSDLTNNSESSNIFPLEILRLLDLINI
ncbi:hypothetical protein Xen7305DRAFT_00026570 [Xenococcus sp. PCC 7305]|uniref:DUF4435 domain-containing protein n=1 Tax=Xenococcus sp. PCC 7305 TaxID=102125 RepID=UPI0002ACCFED|nr:DUF4435 domain-containing protein [Xenococcus sp. PCC 7305]ELS02939.1 hypothetical protein Xen7305DRAFT_00026570 [Xenococcus sp. PCC 7305]